MSEDELVAETTSFYELANDRAKLCDDCPEHGGACDGDGSPLEHGLAPSWDERRLVTKPCGRWDEHVVRKRLMSAGVPKVAAGEKLSSYDRSDHVFNLAVDFVDRAHRGGQWLVLWGDSKTGKTLVAVGILRNLKRKRSRLTLNYTSATHLDRNLKAFYQSRPGEEATDPLAKFREADVAVIELGAVKGMQAHVVRALVDALTDRWERELSTIVTTTSKLRQLHDTFDTLAAKSVVSCQLPRAGGNDGQ